MREIKVVVTMDCEPIKTATHAAATGPGDWALGERAARGYVRIARAFGFPVSFFVHPETALAQGALFSALERDGACLGLHMHPWKYSMSRHGGARFLEHYGGLTEDEQREILAESAALWREGLGYRPRYFRPGTFSANDAVFKVLAELGFRGGSCSLPGRMMPEMRAVWVGAPPDPHRGHRAFRHLDGDLDFANMPVSTDFSLSLAGKLGGALHPDLRPDIDWTAEYGLSYARIARNIVSQVLERRPQVPVVNLLSHNHFDFDDAAHPATQRFTQALDAIVAACRELDARPVGATIADVCDAVLARPAQAQPMVCEGNVYGRAGGVATLGAAA